MLGTVMPLNADSDCVGRWTTPPRGAGLEPVGMSITTEQKDPDTTR